jgi:hypothetical protein
MGDSGSGSISNAFGGKAPGTETELGQFVERNLGYAAFNRSEALGLEAMTNPTTYLEKKNKARAKAVEASKAAFMTSYGAAWEAGAPEEQAKQMALNFAQRDLQARLGIVDELYPAKFDQLVGQTLSFRGLHNTLK